MRTEFASGFAALALLGLAGCAGSFTGGEKGLSAPGTADRPILSMAEANGFTPARYFAASGLYASPTPDPWAPEVIDTTKVKPDFVVGAVGSGAGYDTVQKAVNAAYMKGGKGRIYIKVLPGTYVGAVYVPIDAPPLTVYGDGKAPGDVKLELKLDAIATPADYAVTVNPAAQFKAGDPAWPMFDACASQTSKKIDTPCAAVVWSQGEGFQLKNLSITNTLLDSVDGSTHQAVALRTDGDKTQLENLRLIGRQDTLLVNVGDAPTSKNKIGTYPTTKIARAFVRDSYIEGDTDYVFGRANAVFDHCEFHTVSTRKSDQGIVFAPDTMPGWSYGFLVVDSRITGDKGFAGRGKVKLGRSWDQGASGKPGYVPGKSPSGQLVIRDSYIDDSYDTQKPWGNAATSNRPHAGNVAPGRNLDDPNFNRLWEFNNRGPGAVMH